MNDIIQDSHELNEYNQELEIALESFSLIEQFNQVLDNLSKEEYIHPSTLDMAILARNNITDRLGLERLNISNEEYTNSQEGVITSIALTAVFYKVFQWIAKFFVWLFDRVKEFFTGIKAMSEKIETKASSLKDRLAKNPSFKSPDNLDKYDRIFRFQFNGSVEIDKSIALIKNTSSKFKTNVILDSAKNAANYATQIRESIKHSKDFSKVNELIKKNLANLNSYPKALDLKPNDYVAKHVLNISTDGQNKAHYWSSGTLPGNYFMIYGYSYEDTPNGELVKDAQCKFHKNGFSFDSKEDVKAIDRSKASRIIDDILNLTRDIKRAKDDVERAHKEINATIKINQDYARSKGSDNQYSNENAYAALYQAMKKLFQLTGSLIIAYKDFSVYALKSSMYALKFIDESIS